MKSTTSKQNSAFEHLDAIIFDIHTLIANKQDFVGFIVIALGIEFLGSFYDAFAFEDSGQSESRFKTGVSNLFKNKWYRNNCSWLFTNFRGPLLHQYRSGSSILLTSACKNMASLELHLKLVDGKRIFVLEQLFSDFESAVKKLKNEFKKSSNSLNKQKVNGDYMAIIDIHLSNEDKIFNATFHFPESSGTTTNLSTITKRIDTSK